MIWFGSSTPPGGSPLACHTERMDALGQPQRQRFVMHPLMVGFARHHGVAMTSRKARDAKFKSEVECHSVMCRRRSCLRLNSTVF